MTTPKSDRDPIGEMARKMNEENEISSKRIAELEADVIRWKKFAEHRDALAKQQETEIDNLLADKVMLQEEIRKLRSQLHELEAEVERLKNPWVNVDERRPEKQMGCLVIAPQSFPKNHPHVVAEYYDDNEVFYSESSDEPMLDVTHWMPLPEPPKEVNP